MPYYKTGISICFVLVWGSSTMIFLLLSFHFISNSMCQENVPLEDPVYVLNMDSTIYVCPDESSQAFVDTSEIEVHRHNESTTYMTGSLKLLKSVDRQTVIEILVEKETSGRYDLIASVEISDFCDELEDPESIYVSYLKYLGFPEQCPVESRAYNVDNFVADSRDLPINSANAGRYQATLNIYDNPSGACKHDKIFLACVKIDFVVEPM